MAKRNVQQLKTADKAMLEIETMDAARHRLTQALMRRGATQTVAIGVSWVLVQGDASPDSIDEAVIAEAMKRVEKANGDVLSRGQGRSVVNVRGNPARLIECSTLADLAGEANVPGLDEDDPLRLAFAVIATNARNLRLLTAALGGPNFDLDGEAAIRAAASSLTAAQLILEDILEVSGEGYEPVSASSTPANDVTTSARGGAQQ